MSLTLGNVCLWAYVMVTSAICIGRAQITPPSAKNASSKSYDFLSDYINSGGVFPNVAATAQSGPIRTECGIGALMPWADHLYMVKNIDSIKMLLFLLKCKLCSQ